MKARRLDFEEVGGQNVAKVGAEARMSSLMQSANFMAGLRFRLSIGGGQQQDEKTNCNWEKSLRASQSLIHCQEYNWPRSRPDRDQTMLRIHRAKNTIGHGISGNPSHIGLHGHTDWSPCQQDQWSLGQLKLRSREVKDIKPEIVLPSFFTTSDASTYIQFAHSLRCLLCKTCYIWLKICFRNLLTG